MYVNGNTLINCCCCCCICVKKTDKNLACLGVRIVTSVSRGKEISGHFYSHGYFFLDFVKFTVNKGLPAI